MKRKIGIFIPTCNRIDMLKNLVNKLINNYYINNNNICIYIVDNDKFNSAKEVINEYQSDIIKYFSEKNKGYSTVRNRCLDIARSEKCDYIVFIDDDEYPHEQWLEKLYERIVKEKCTAVIGPVYAIIDERAPNWIKKNKKDFDRINKNARYTGNTIFNVKSIEGLYFDNNFDVFGGEDVKFFESIEKDNGKIVFEEKAIVYEFMPLKRTKLIYFANRAFRSGVADIILVKSYNCKANIIKVFLKSLYNIFTGIVTGIYSLVKNTNIKKKAIVKLCKGIGRIYGIFFIKYNTN
ncbi:glycosyltransferase family 2 protein [Clostridium perfringens]|nr:glycosyltransferase family 2 protein [Clostridium perfringens]